MTNNPTTPTQTRLWAGQSGRADELRANHKPDYSGLWSGDMVDLDKARRQSLKWLGVALMVTVWLFIALFAFDPLGIIHAPACPTEAC